LQICIVNFKECDFKANMDNIVVEIGNRDSCTKVENEGTIIDIDFDDSDERMSDTNDGNSICSDIYRYSDSDADSIFSDEDFDDDFDFDNVLQNLVTSKDEKFRTEITTWAINYQINHKALKALLIILNKYTSTQFCQDPRTLLKTPKNTNIIEIDSGHYCHLGVKNCLKKIIENKRALNNKINTVNLLVNIDGAPLVGNSSEKGLWIILCRDPEVESVHLIGVYCGAKKPEDQNNFLKYFVEESVDLINNGFTHNEILYYVRIYGFICDAPAKAFVLCTTYHSGYSSCSKCLIEGEYYSSVCFPVSNIKKLEMYCNDYLRTDIKFKNLEYMGEYQRGETILNQLPHVGLVSNVPLDSMHLVYLGAMKQLIRHWIGDKDRKKKLFKLSDQQIE